MEQYKKKWGSEFIRYKDNDHTYKEIIPDRRQYVKEKVKNNRLSKHVSKSKEYWSYKIIVVNTHGI